MVENIDKIVRSYNTLLSYADPDAALSQFSSEYQVSPVSMENAQEVKRAFLQPNKPVLRFIKTESGCQFIVEYPSGDCLLFPDFGLSPNHESIVLMYYKFKDDVIWLSGMKIKQVIRPARCKKIANDQWELSEEGIVQLG